MVWGAGGTVTYRDWRDDISNKHILWLYFRTYSSQVTFELAGQRFGPHELESKLLVCT